MVTFGHVLSLDSGLIRAFRYQLMGAPLTVEVAFTAPASGLVTVDVDQSEYGFQ